MSGLVAVTGAATGIGLAIATRLSGEHPLLLVDRDPGVSAAAAPLVEAVALHADLTTPDGPAQVAAAVAASGHTLAGLVNNAGITRDARLLKMTPEEFTAVLQVNLGAAYRVTRALISHLGAGSSVVNMSSRAYLGNFGQFNYSMSKGGLVGMTRALALELAPRVRVNAVAPGLTATAMTAAMPPEVLEKLVARIPMGRPGRPEEVADLVAFLLSERSSYATGGVFVLGGGRSLTR